MHEGGTIPPNENTSMSDVENPTQLFSWFIWGIEFSYDVLKDQLSHINPLFLEKLLDVYVTRIIIRIIRVKH